jgi:hypothetical protein
MEQFDTRFVVPVLRTFVDPADPDDIAAVNSLQDEVSVEASTSGSYEHPDYDEASRKETFDALVKLAEGLPDAERMFGKKGDVDPVRHLIGTAFGWGGLPTSEAYYLTRSEPRPVGRYALTLRDVPVDGFWSMTIYNGDGFLEANAHDAYSLNGVTAIADEDGSITLNLAPDRDGLSNYLYVMEGGTSSSGSTSHDRRCSTGRGVCRRFARSRRNDRCARSEVHAFSLMATLRPLTTTRNSNGRARGRPHGRRTTIDRPRWRGAHSPPRSQDAASA